MKKRVVQGKKTKKFVSNRAVLVTVTHDDGSTSKTYPALLRKHKKNHKKAYQSVSNHATRLKNKGIKQAAWAAHEAANRDKWVAARAAKLAKDIADHTTVVQEELPLAA